MSDYNLGTASGKIEVDGRGAAIGFKVAETAAGAFFSVIDAKVKSVQQLGRRMAAVGAAGTLTFAGAINAAADFQQQMSGVQAVTNSTGDEFEALRQKALQLGADTVYSASEAATAIEELAKAGIPVKDILDGAAEGAVALAAAGGIGLEEAATVAANAMNQFGLGADKVVGVADILAGVANTSAADVSSLGQSLAQSGAVANLAGLSFRDTAIALGEMADAGIQGSDAGTSIKTMLNNLIPTTTKQIMKFEELKLLTFNLADANKVLAKEHLPLAKNMDDVYKTLNKYNEELDKGEVGTMKNAKATQDLMLKTGILNNEFFDAKGNIKNLGGIQKELGRALKDMTKEQKLATLETLFGADAMRASAILSLAGGKGYREFSKAVSETSAADVAKTRLNNLNGAIEAFKGSMETVMITVGNVFLPAVTMIVHGATAVLNAFNRLPAPIKTAIAIVAAIGSAVLLLGGLLLAFFPVILAFIANFMLMRSLSIVITFLRTLWTAVAAGQPILASTSLAAQAAGKSFMRMGKMALLAGKMMWIFSKFILLVRTSLIFLLTNPYMLALYALVAVAVLLYKKWKPFRDLVDGIAAVLKAAFIDAWHKTIEVLQQAWEALKQFGSYITSSLGPTLKQVGRMLKGALFDAFREIADAVKNDLMPAIQELAGTFQGEIMPALQDLGQAIKPIAKIVGTVLVAAFMIYLKVLQKFYGFVISKIAPLFIKVFGQAILTFIKILTRTIKAVIQIFSGLITYVTGWINIFKGIFTGDWALIWKGVQQIFEGAWTAILGMLKLVTAQIFEILKVLWSHLPGPVQEAMRKILSVIMTTWNFIRSSTSAVWNAVKSIISTQIAIAKTIVSVGVAAIKAYFGLLAAIVGKVREWFTNIVTAIKTKLQEAIDFVKGMPDKMLGIFIDLAQDFYDAGAELMRKLGQGISDFADQALGPLDEIAGALADKMPGSPVKEGPLKSFNRGAAGKKLMEFLSEGIDKEHRRTAESASRAALAISDAFNKNMAFKSAAVTMAGSIGSAAVRGGVRHEGPVRHGVRPKKGKNGKMRLVEGHLTLDRSGRAFIRGVAADEVDDDDDFEDTLERMG